MPPISVPVEFKNLCRWLHQDVMLIHPSLEAAIVDATDQLKVDQCRVIRRFLDDLLTKSHDDAELEKVWSETPAEVFFAKRDLRKALESIRQIVTSKLAKFESP